MKIPVIFILNGHKSHLSLQLSEFCKKNEIILLRLPPNCMHILQLLDVAFFKSLKICWKTEVDCFKYENGQGTSKAGLHCTS